MKKRNVLLTAVLSMSLGLLGVLNNSNKVSADQTYTTIKFTGTNYSESSWIGLITDHSFTASDCVNGTAPVVADWVEVTYKNQTAHAAFLTRSEGPTFLQLCNFATNENLGNAEVGDTLFIAANTVIGSFKTDIDYTFTWCSSNYWHLNKGNATEFSIKEVYSWADYIAFKTNEAFEGITTKTTLYSNEYPLYKNGTLTKMATVSVQAYEGTSLVIIEGLNPSVNDTFTIKKDLYFGNWKIKNSIEFTYAGNNKWESEEDIERENIRITSINFAIPTIIYVNISKALPEYNNNQKIVDNFKISFKRGNEVTKKLTDLYYALPIPDAPMVGIALNSCGITPQVGDIVTINSGTIFNQYKFKTQYNFTCTAVEAETASWDFESVVIPVEYSFTTLRNSTKNEVIANIDTELDYLNGDVICSDASLSYKNKDGKNTLTATLTYVKDADGQAISISIPTGLNAAANDCIYMNKETLAGESKNLNVLKARYDSGSSKWVLLAASCSGDHTTDGHWHTDTSITDSDGCCGHEDYSYCTVCGEKFYVDTPHNWVAGQVVAPTCTESGYTIYTCSNCDETKHGDETNPLGHDWVVETVVQPTCTEPGYTVYKCSRCNETKNDNPTAALGHDYVLIPAKAATTTEFGNIDYYQCSRCGKLFILQNGSYVEITIADTIIDKIPVVEEKGCGSSIGLSSLIISTFALAGVVVLKRKED